MRTTSPAQYGKLRKSPSGLEVRQLLFLIKSTNAQITVTHEPVCADLQSEGGGENT
jgi:hypothetical protein